jgi:hypothetical protein
MKRAWRTISIAIMLAMPHLLVAQSDIAAPLPLVETVLRRVVEQSKNEAANEREFKELYAYKRTKVTEYSNSKGKLAKRDEQKSVRNPLFIPVANRPPRRTEPRSDSMGAEKNGAVAGTDAKAKGKAFERNDFALNEDLLARFEFTLAGREMVNQRPALILDFKPANRKLPERSVKERFINKAAGRIWVDEADYALVKADLHLTEKVRVVGGLVGSVSNFNYELNRERTADGLWFTREVNWHLEGRELLARRTIDYQEEKSDVRRVRQAGAFQAR